MKRRVLVTGAGGVAGVDFVKALRYTNKYFLLGTDYFTYHLVFPSLDVRFQTPKHSDPTFIPMVKKIVEKNGVEFLHPQPTSEARVISEHREKLPAKIFLPTPQAMDRGFDKLITARMLEERGVPVPKTRTINQLEEIEGLFEDLGDTLWVRVRGGAGGTLSLPCQTPEEAKLWVELWIKKGRAEFSDWMFQEYVGGKDVAWDSLWFQGRLVTSFSRERLEYPFKHQLPSGVGGTPSASRIIVDEKMNDVGVKAVLALDENPHGFYCIDLKYTDKPYVTEVNVGKAHTTLPLWSYGFHRILKEPYFNIPDIYVRAGLSGEVPGDIPKFDLFPEGYYLLRHLDCGGWLWREDGWKKRII